MAKPGGDLGKAGTVNDGVAFIYAIWAAADVVDALGLNNSGKALKSIIAQQDINRKDAEKITTVMEEYIDHMDRGGVGGLDDTDLAYIDWISRGIIENPENFAKPKDMRKHVRKTLEGVPDAGTSIGGGTTLPKPQNAGPTQGSTVGNTNLYEAAKGQGGVDPATGEGRIGTISNSPNPLNTAKTQLAGQAGIKSSVGPIQETGPPQPPNQGVPDGNPPPTNADLSPSGLLSSYPMQGPPTPSGPPTGPMQGPPGPGDPGYDPTVNPNSGVDTPDTNAPPTSGTGSSGTSTGTSGMGGSGLPPPSGTQNQGGNMGWLQKNAGWLGFGGDLLGGGIAAWGSIKGAEDYADALIAQGQGQDKLSRDVLQTGLEFSNEIVDIGLGLGEPFRVAGIGALAGMSDMLGMDRQAFGEFMGLPPEAKFESTGRMNAAGTREFGYKAGEFGFQTQRGQFTEAEEKRKQKGPQGESLYQPEYDYDRQRIDKGTQLYYDAPEFDWQAPLKEAGFSFEQGGTAGFQSIFNNLAVIAGFGPQQSPNGAGGAAGIANAGNNLVGSQNYISGAGSALAQGKTGAYNAVGGAFTGMFGNAGWSQGG